MYHKRILKRKRGQETDKRRNKVEHDTVVTTGQIDRENKDRTRGLSYRPLSRPTGDISSVYVHSFRNRSNKSATNKKTFDNATRPRNRSRPTVQNSPPPSVNQFPLDHLSYPEPFFRYPMTPNEGQTDTGYPGSGCYSQLPPGAYVNPTFFTRENETTPQTSSPSLPQDVQQQMDILNYFRRYARG